MFKSIITLFRGAFSAAGEEIADKNALLILDQQLRDATFTLHRAKKSLALAIAQNQQEAARLKITEAGITDLEPRIIAALATGNDDLAHEGAEAIAALETDRDASLTALALFGAEISRLRSHLTVAEARMAAVDRGRCIARASEASRRLRGGGIESSRPHKATLSEAEATLKRLRDRQIEAQIADQVLDRIDAASGPLAAAEKLAASGFGPRLKTTAGDVLARLRSSAPQAA